MHLKYKLGLIALAGFPCCISIYKLATQKFSDDIKKSRFYAEAMEALKQNKGAVYLLGEPITDFKAKFNSPGYSEIKRMDVKAVISGPKSSGVLFYSTLADENGEIQLDTVQLQVGKDDTRRLVIKKSRKETNSNSSNSETTNSSPKKELSSSENS